MTARTLVLTALLSAALASPASAADLTVNSLTDDGDGTCDATCTLRDAVDQAGSADRVIVPAGAYSLTEGQLQLAGDTIVGAGARTTLISAQSNERVMYLSSGANHVSGVSLTGGEAHGDPTMNGIGGGIAVELAASLTLTDATVRGNEALQGGGIGARGVVTVLRSTLSGNRASAPTSGAQGGGLWLVNTSTVRNSTISGNEAINGESPTTVGGGIYVGGASVTVVGTTIAGNEAFEGSAVYTASVPGSALSLSHTIVETGLPTGFGSCAGAALQTSTSIVDDASCGGTVADPQLGPLTNNGGPTDTFAIADTSPAVNAGTSCDPTDQRGVARVGACDIGAYETAVPGGSQPPPPGGLPDPVPGKTVNAFPKGTVKIKLPGSNRFVTLTEDRQLRVGTIVDVTKGRVTLVTAGGGRATFYDGIFKISQGKGAKPLTTLTLVEKLSCKASSARATAAAKKKTKRRLWGDGSGRFRVKGKHSAATVVGTKWLVEDRCRSTLTKVTKGKVSVRDFVKKKTVIVKAGKQYVARARKR